MESPKQIVLLDSLGDLFLENTCPILVCGSHCGGNKELAAHVKKCNIQAVFLNNAGVGKNNAGIKGLSFYEAEGIIACAVSHNSAEIGIAQDTWDNGIITHVNSQAELAGIQVGDSVQTAADTLIKSNILTSAKQSIQNSELPNSVESNVDTKANLKKQFQTEIHGVTITVTDSVTFLYEHNYGDIVVCASHGGLSAGEYAHKYKLKAVFFNDAGIGKNNAGVKSLDILSEQGILACTVDCMSAEIFNGQDVLDNGIITVCNELAHAKGIAVGMGVKEAVVLV